MKRNIAFDLRPLGEKPSGVGRYISNLLKEQLSLDNYRYHLLLHPSQENLLNQFKGDFSPLFCPFKMESHPMSEIWMTFIFPIQTKKRNLSLFHSTAFVPPIIKTKTPWVTSIHDLVSINFGQSLPLKWKLFLNYQIKKAIQNSQAIISMSHSIRHEIKKAFPLSPPIFVTPLGSHLSLPQQKGKSQKHKILYVGNLEPRKGIINLLESFELLKKSSTMEKTQLILVGQALWGFKKHQEIIQQSKYSKDIILKGYVNDQTLTQLYQEATLCVVPSEYEGFGLPVLESTQSLGPILVNDIPVFREIGKDYVHFVSFKKHKETAKLMEKLLTQESNPQYYKPYEQLLNKYNWKNCAIKTIQVYEKYSI